MTATTNTVVTLLARRTRPCPTCGAAPDEPCVSKSGREFVSTFTHRARREELETLYLSARTDPRPLAWAESRS